MKSSDLWKRYCGFYEKDFSDQMESNESRMNLYFNKWKRTSLAGILCRTSPTRLQDVPITRYGDYPMLSEFGREIVKMAKENPKKPRELYRDYYDRIGREIGSTLDRYMTEPYYLCMKTTGSTGENKWIAHGETFWNNFASGAIACAVISCSEGWGGTKLKVGDKCLNMTAPIPYISGWGALASQTHLKMIPPIEVTDSLQDMKGTFLLILKAIQRGEKIVLGGGMGSTFYTICKYFVDPEEFYEESSRSMNFGLRKALIYLKLLQCKIGRGGRRAITDFMPLKGVLVGGMEARLYIEFFRTEFGLEPLHAYGATEAGNLMRGDPDRKADLVPDLRTSYLEFQTEGGEVKRLDELRKDEIYDLIVTPFGSILFRYDMEDLFRVIDFRDDGMPVFEFEGRKTTVIDLYNYRVTPNVIVHALSKAGLRSSDKWAVTKLFKPRERLHFLMEKTWPCSEREAEKIIFDSLLETERMIPDRGRLLTDYVTDFKIRDPSEVIEVKYLKPGAFLRYAMRRAKAGSPIGQYKPPKIIPPEKTEIYEILRSA